MSIPGSASPLFFKAAAAAAAGGGVATRSLRFNPGDSAYLNKTFSSAGDRRTFTYSYWIKECGKGSSPSNNPHVFWSGTGSSTRGGLVHRGTGSNANELYIFNQESGSTNCQVWTNSLHRDFSAWKHIVWSIDTTQSTSTNRVKLYINGVQETLNFATTPAQNLQLQININQEHRIGRGTPDDYGNFYLADIHFIDGSALDATSFGAFDDNNVWQAAVFSGTYGTNGFHLAFGDNSSNAALGTDSSGNSNTFTVNNLKANNTGNSAGFKPVTYSGTGSSQSITSLSIQPDLIWIKSRSSAQKHVLVDSVRTTSTGEYLASNSNQAEGTGVHISGTSDGFTINNPNASTIWYNDSSHTYVAWCWKAGGTASSNSDGTITSSVSASTEYGFSVVTFTGPGSAGFASVGHGLGQKPKVIFCKDRDNNRNWSVFHEDVITSDTDILSLNQDVATFTSGTAAWDVSAIDSSTFTPYFRDDFGPSYGADNVAYCWAEKTGFSKFGTYTGNGNTSGGGPRVELGFKPAFLLVKGFNVQSGWRIFDSTRDSGGQFQKRLYADTTSTESTNSTQYVDYDDTGFDVEASGSLSTYNVSGKTYIYMAFAQDPGGDVIDSLLDVPTNGTQTDTGAGGEVSGNYATWSPLVAQTSGSITLSNGNLDTTCGTTRTTAMSSFPLTGKTYWEITFGSGTYNYIGMTEATGFNTVANNNSGIKYTGYKDYSYGWGQSDGNLYKASNILSSSPGQYSNGDVVGWAYDADNNTLKLYKNGSLVHTENNIADAQYFPAITHSGTATATTNFGQRPFAYAAPSGYKPVSTATSLPTPTIADGRDYFDAKLWTGNSTDQRAITGYQFSPDFVWIKRRNASYGHPIMDTVRGLNSGHAGVIYANATNAEDTGATSSIRSFNSDGFNLGTDGGINYSGSTYVGWAWDAGSSTVSNTDGNVTTNVRANTAAGFSIVTYTGSGSSTASYGHGLNAEPHMIMTKKLSAANDWYIYFKASGNSALISLNSSSSFGSLSNYWGTVNNTVFSQTYSSAGPNNGDQVAYCFAPVEGYSAFGSYTGNGSTDGPFVHTNFRPAFLLVKCADTNGTQWTIYDASRDPSNVVQSVLWADTSEAEFVNSVNNIDFLSNGFKIRNTHIERNTSGDTYIYAAFAENPFQANGGLTHTIGLDPCPINLATARLLSMCLGSTTMFSTQLTG